MEKGFVKEMSFKSVVIDGESEGDVCDEVISVG